MKKNHWNIIVPNGYVNQIKKSKYFQQDLGRSHLVHNEKKGDKELREGEFTTWYYNKYRSLVVKSGYIGPLHFYIDYQLDKEIIGFFLNKDSNKHQYAIGWEQQRVNELGIDSWLSEKLKLADQSLSDEVNKKDKQEETQGNPNTLITNPGGATWKDIEAYYKKKKSNV